MVVQKIRKLLLIHFVTTTPTSLILIIQKYLISQGIKLANPDTDIKTYWSILKTFLNKTKTPSIPPILHNNIFITDFLEKANLFNQYFAHQCTILDTEF